MKNLFELFGRWRDGEDVEFGIVLEWYGLLGIAAIVLCAVFSAWR